MLILKGVSVSISHLFSTLAREFTSVDSKGFIAMAGEISFRTELKLKTDGLLRKQHFIIVVKSVKDN